MKKLRDRHRRKKMWVCCCCFFCIQKLFFNASDENLHQKIFSTGTSDKFRLCNLFSFTTCCSHMPPAHYLGSMMRSWEGFRWRQWGKWFQDPCPGGLFPLSRRKSRGALRPWIYPEAFLELGLTLSRSCLCCVRRFCLLKSFLESEVCPALLHLTIRNRQARTWLVTEPYLAHPQPQTQFPPPWPLKYLLRASLVAQWLRICLPMQGTRVWALVWEDPTCRGATGPVSHNYWACVSGACAPQQERPW